MLRIIDTETCGLQGGIVEIASVDVIDGKIVNPMSHQLRLLPEIFIYEVNGMKVYL